jgi:hypothetical protein
LHDTNWHLVRASVLSREGGRSMFGCHATVKE